MVYFLIIALLGIITFLNNSKIRELEDEIIRLKQAFRDLEGKIMLSGSAALSKAQEKAEKKVESNIISDADDVKPQDLQEEPFQEKPKPTHTPVIQKMVHDIPVQSASQKSRTSVPLSTSHADWIKTAQDSFEKNVATKLPVWIGAVSLIFAAFFLVKYSMEVGFMTPFVRVLMGAGFGVILLMAGKWIIKREHIANHVRLSQGLVGAGLVALYVSVYASIHLYSLISPTFAFAAMALITALAVVLSLRHGQPIAVFGLLGGLLTPALIGSEEPNAFGLFAYLFLLFSGLFLTMVRKKWWVLALVSLIGVFGWSALWFITVFSSSDAIVLILFALGITGVVLTITGKRVAEDSIEKSEQAPIHGLNITAIAGGTLTIIWVSFKMSLTLFDWSMMGLFSLALLALAFFQPAVYRPALGFKLAASLIVFFIWMQEASFADSLMVMAGIAAIYISGSAVLMRRVKDPRFWAGLQAITTISLYGIAYVGLKVPNHITNSFDLLWGMIALLIAAVTIYQAADIRKKYTADKTMQDYLVAIYALLASTLISLGLAIELPWEYVPLALAGQAFITAFIYNVNKIEFLKTIVIILTAGFVVLSYEPIIEFLKVMLMSLEGNTPPLNSLAQETVASIFIKLGLPALFALGAFRIFLKNKNDDQALDNALYGVVVTFGFMAIYALSRTVIHGDYATAMSTPESFIERGFISIFIAICGIALTHRLSRQRLAHLKPWAIGLLCIAAFRYVYFDVFMQNPYWDADQNVGEIFLLNGVTLTFGGATLLWAWALMTSHLVINKKAYMTFSFISLFAFVSLTVRQLFHGGNLAQGNILSSELYAYSVAWLSTGLALLTIGIMKDIKPARMASLAFILLAIVKVFLFDAAELDGLYRVFSFLGLGVSLMGLSFFYSKFVFQKKL